MSGIMIIHNGISPEFVLLGSISPYRFQAWLCGRECQGVGYKQSAAALPSKIRRLLIPLAFYTDNGTHFMSDE
jgi:hypothetical protein